MKDFICPDLTCPNLTCSNLTCPNVTCPNLICPDLNCPDLTHSTSFDALCMIPTGHQSCWTSFPLEYLFHWTLFPLWHVSTGHCSHLTLIHWTFFHWDICLTGHYSYWNFCPSWHLSHNLFVSLDIRDHFNRIMAPLNRRNKHWLRPFPLTCLYYTWMVISLNMCCIKYLYQSSLNLGPYVVELASLGSFRRNFFLASATRPQRIIQCPRSQGLTFW